MASGLTPELDEVTAGIPSSAFRGCRTFVRDLSKANFVIMRVQSQQNPTVSLIGFAGSAGDVCQSILELRRPRAKDVNPADLGVLGRRPAESHK